MLRPCPNLLKSIICAIQKIEMKFQDVDELNLKLKSEIRRLWNQEYPANIYHPTQKETDDYLIKLIDPRHTFVFGKEGEVVAWFVDFDRGGKRFFAMIVDECYQGQGIGSKLLELGMSRNAELNGWIVSDGEYKTKAGKPYASPRNFYRKNNFDFHIEIKSETHILKTHLISRRN